MGDEREQGEGFAVDGELLDLGRGLLEDPAGGGGGRGRLCAGLRVDAGVRRLPSSAARKGQGPAMSASRRDSGRRGRQRILEARLG